MFIMQWATTKILISLILIIPSILSLYFIFKIIKHIQNKPKTIELLTEQNRLLREQNKLLKK